MSSPELFISSPRCTCADVSDYVIWLLCARLLVTVSSVAAQCQSLIDFITLASSKPSLDFFPRKCTYAKVIDLRNIATWTTQWRIQGGRSLRQLPPQTSVAPR